MDECKNSSREMFFFHHFIIVNNLKCLFPNIEVALRMYLVLMVTNYTAEGSFSKMKIIKNRLYTKMTKNRLSSLTLLSIESDVTRKIEIKNFIKHFLHKTSRKIDLK